MSVQALDVLFGLLALFLVSKAYQVIANRGRPPLPPGPRGLPIIGNLLDLPKKQPQVVWAKWAEKWGDIMSMQVPGMTFIIVNSTKVASDLMEKRSANYSDRFLFFMMTELIGWKDSFLFAQDGDPIHRDGRRQSARIMGSSATLKRYQPAQEMEARKLVWRVYQEPEILAIHLREVATSLMLRMIYGYEVKNRDDPLFQLTEDVLTAFKEASILGAWTVDFLPIMRFIPSWFPGAKWKRLANQWNADKKRLNSEPYKFTKDQMAAGTAQPSFVEDLLNENPPPEKEPSMQSTALTLTGGGSDTTVGQLHSFILAMILHPEVFKKAQAEVDSATGGERLPSFSDADQLPYVTALVTEVFRWHTMVPTVAHKAREDDVYEGYFIPKGAVIIGNTWQMLHNPEVYKDPMTFNPERFLGPNPEPSKNVWFGFGRRICPGMHLATQSVWIAVASLLAVFDIKKALDENGKPITPEHVCLDGAISHCEEFPYSITPRSENAAALIRAAAES